MFESSLLLMFLWVSVHLSAPFILFPRFSASHSSISIISAMLDVFPPSSQEALKQLFGKNVITTFEKWLAAKSERKTRVKLERIKEDNKSFGPPTECGTLSVLCERTKAHVHLLVSLCWVPTRTLACSYFSASCGIKLPYPLQAVWGWWLICFQIIFFHQPLLVQPTASLNWKIFQSSFLGFDWLDFFSCGKRTQTLLHVIIH